MLEIKKLDIGYSDNLLIKNSNFIFEPGRVYSIVGNNGSGKTSLLRTIIGFIPALNGSVLVNNDCIANWSLVKKSTVFSVLFSRNDIDPNVTVRELLNFSLGDFFTNVEDSEQYKSLVTYFSVDNLLDKPFRYMSDGQKQIVLIARLFLKPANIYLMDEPTIYLDVRTKNLLNAFIKQFIAQNDAVIIFISHDKSFVEDISDVTLAVNAGSLVRQ